MCSRDFQMGRPAWFAVCATLLVWGWSGGVGAQEAGEPQQESQGAIQEVVVTAERRESNLQDTPIALSVMDANVLANRGITDLEGVVKATPSMSFTPYNPSSNTLALFMRGSGVQDPGQITIDTAVGLYQDGFYISRAQLVTFDLADIERVEVLRGPQGTLYGRNTTGGAVNLISKKPTGEFGFKQELGFGSSGRIRSLSVLDLPKWGGLSAKFSFIRRKQDGYVENLGPSHDFGEDDQTAGRVALRWDTGGPFTADYFYERGDLNSTPAYYTNDTLVGLIPGYSDRGRPEDRSYRAIDLPESKGRFEGHGLTLSWNVNDALTLKSLTGYRDINTIYFQDYAEAFFVGFRSQDNIHSHQFSQELQAVGSMLDDRVKYVAGLYYFEEAGWHFQNTVITNALPGSSPLLLNKDRFVSMESKSRAFYTQLTWTPPILDDQLELTFGGRYTKDERAATRTLLTTFFGFPIAQEPAPGLINSNNVESSRFNPSFTANYHWTDDVNTYLRVATGYKAGGSSESVDVGMFGLTFKPEDVKVYELGLKSYLFDRRVRLNAALFNSEYEDMQLFFPTNPGDLSVLLAVNAGKASIRGLELEALWQPMQDLSFTVNYTYLDPKYDEVLAPAGTIFDPAVNPASPYQVGQNVKNLFSFGYAPENSVDAGAKWTFLKFGNGDLTASLDYRWQDRTFHTGGAGPAVPNYLLASRPAFGLLDGRLSWQMDFANDHQLRVDFWGKNLADKAWPLYVVASGSPVPVQDPLSGAVTPPGFSFQPIAWAERRSYGVNFVYQF
ncbi:MAG: Vitamin B12 transporter BtuB [Steroidobacteraceae bacterium]|nr:Vitamin B12 transporter BtuB [Steroidobacteraceae bacterium]